LILNTSESDRFDELPNNLRACIDWLSFTFYPHCGLNIAEIISFLGFKEIDFIQLPKGANGYRSMLKFNGANIRILFDGKPDMGIHVDISGSAISDVLLAWKNKNTMATPFGTVATCYTSFDYSILLDLLDALSEIATFTRIDLSIDDIGCNYYSCNDIVRLIENNQLVSKFKKYENKSPRLLSNGQKVGHTIYLGSRQSEIMIRIYDKQLEFYQKHDVKCPYEWVRWEMELKKSRANEAVKRLLETHSLSSVCIGILNQYLRFIKLDNSSKAKCSNDSVWDSFIGGMEKVSLYVPDSPKTIEDTKRWIDKYVGASLCAVIEADGGSLDFIYKNLPKWQRQRKRNRNLTNRLIRETKKFNKET